MKHHSNPKPMIHQMNRTMLQAMFSICAAVVLSLAAYAQSPDPVLLISLDGFRNDYPEKTETPNLTALAKAGVRAEALRPVFPSKTFTNHYTIATGLLPKHHGVISNTMYDAEMNAWFRLSDTGAVRNAAWWGGEPIWVTAVKQRQRSACFFWPGTEAAIGGIRPTYWKPYVHQTPHEERIAQVLAWFDLPSEERPSIITLYFSDTDDAGHRFGPDAPELKAAIQKVDSSVGRLLDGLAARGLRDKVNILVVSDHGMSAVDTSRIVYWDDALDASTVRSIEEGPVLTFNAPADSVPVYVQRLNRLSLHLKAYANADLPARFLYSGHRRIPSIIGLVDDGWTVTRRNRRGGYPISGGAHGYDHEFPSMQALFIADGPAFKSGARVDTVMNLDVYELLCHLLKLKPAPNDGSFERIRSVLEP
jgi:predicted AlkP superfamily pyrophosphatase or phosphodiesterase